MRSRMLASVIGGCLAGLLLTGTARLQWHENQVVQGPPIALDSDSSKMEFVVDLSLEMCEPGPEFEPVSLFMDLSAGLDLLEEGADTADGLGDPGPTVTVTLYPSDGTEPIVDEAIFDTGSVGVYLSTPQIGCPAHGSCERGYIVVFEVSDGSAISGWWNVTASAIGPNKSQGEYEGRITLDIAER